MKKKLQKLLLLAATLLVGTNAWGAGYTRTLTDQLEVAGYKVNTFYDFQNNNPEVLPTSGGLRYRDGGNWGLHNFDSGSRSATVNIAVEKDQLLVLQDYSNNTTVNVGTLDQTLSNSTGYRCFKINTTASTITLSCPRYGGVVAALLMDVDNSAATADYTINYVYNSTTVKTTTGNGAVGVTVLTDASFFVDDVKYIRADGETESFEIASGGNTLTVNVRLANTYSYTVKSSLGTTITSGTGLEGDAIYYHYPQVLKSGNTLYTTGTDNTGVDNNGFKSKLVLDQDNKEVTKTYTAGVTNLVFLGEGEELFTRSTGVSADTRMSMGAGGYATSKTAIITLPAGSYTLSGVNRGSGTASNHVFYKGDEEFFTTTPQGYNVSFSQNFTLAETTTIYMNGGGNSRILDYVYIYGTPTNEIVGALDFSSAANSVRSTNYTMKQGDTKVFTFRNHGTTYENNWRIEVKEGDVWKSNTCADSYDYTANRPTNVTSYTESTDGGTTQEPLNWDDYAADMADALVVATLTYGTNGTLSIRTTSTGTSSGYIYYVDNDVTGLTGDLTINLSVCNSWLEVFSVTTPITVYKAVGGMTTLASDDALDFTDTEVKAYIATGTADESNATVVSLKKVEAIPAGTPVLVYYPETMGDDVSKSFNVPVVASADVITDTNLFVRGTGAAVATSDGDYTNYVLTTSGTDYGFYWANNRTVGTGKAYLHVQTSNSIKLRFDDGNEVATGIINVENESKLFDGATYNLAGQRVGNGYKGIVIRNGKKYLVK